MKNEFQKKTSIGTVIKLSREPDASMRFPVFHVPHDGNEFPGELLRSVCIPINLFLAYHEKMRDKDAGALIPPLCRSRDMTCAFALSRLLCDVERFIGPEEVMEQYGMGFCYEKAFDGAIIKRVTDDLKAKTRVFYDAHHSRINRLCKQHRRILFFDMHSYSSEIVPRDFLRSGMEPPDLCVGVDARFTPPGLVSDVVSGFQAIGLTVAVNYPYSGCYVPEAVMNGETCCDFSGIMLEFHRKVYLDSQDSLVQKKVEKIQDVIRQIMLQWGCMSF